MTMERLEAEALEERPAETREPMGDEGNDKKPGVLDQGEFARRAGMVVGMAAGTVLLLGLLVLALDIVLVIFAGVLLAVLLRAVSDRLAAKTPLGQGWALVIVVLAMSSLLVLLVLLLGPGAAIQMESLAERFPDSVEQLADYLRRFGFGRHVVSAVENLDPNELVGRLGGVLVSGTQVVVYAVTFLFVGLFLAMRPSLYINGVIRLFPLRRRPAVERLLVLLGRTLRWFLLGRLASMTMVAVSTMVALWLLGVPLAGVLGLLAGLLTFAPYVGPILGGVPIVAVALIESPFLALWALIAYTIVQWIEGYLLDPLIQQRMVELPPAITIVSQVLLGLFAGGIGVAVATPLAAVVMVVVQVVWVRGVLGDPIHAGPRGLGRRKKLEVKKAEINR